MRVDTDTLDLDEVKNSLRSSKIGAHGSKIDLMLDILLTLPHSDGLDQDVIAEVVGCSREYISWIERRAMRKLRHYAKQTR